MPASRDPLPIDAELPRLLAALAGSPNAIVVAPPGAGKTTRVPPALLELAGGRRVVMLEPRRVATRAAARRMALERGGEVGDEVGYQVRHERRWSDATRIVVVTEGTLVQWLQRDPFLEEIGVVVFDELHERGLFADLSLALARRVQVEARPDLRLIAMSATLETAPLAAFLGEASIVESRGRLHPVAIEYSEAPAGGPAKPLELRVASGVGRALAATAGDVLVFLPGKGEIARAAEALAPLARERALDLVPLHGDLASAEQDRALARGARRRIVLATNVAETSVTIDGVGAVVDSGLVRRLVFDPALGLDRLELGRVSLASAAQRSGRAGRQGPGWCLRLWGAADELAMRPHETAEIRRADLGWALLQLAAFGEPDLAAFPWLEAPDPARLARAIAQLEDLGALDAGRITALGRRLASFSLSPRLGRLRIEGERLGVADAAAALAEELAERDRPAAPSHPRPGGRSDLLDRLPADGRRAAGSGRETALLRAIAAAWIDRLCRRREPRSPRAVMVGGRGVRLAPSSALALAADELFVAVALDAGREGERSESIVRLASPVDPGWIPGEAITVVDELAFDSGRGRVVARRIRRFRDLELDARETPIADADQAAALLAIAAAAALEAAFDLEEPRLVALRARLAFLARHRPELAVDPLSPAAAPFVLDDDGLRALVPGLAVGKRSFAELRALPLAEIVEGLLSPRLRQALAVDAPERLGLPSGRSARIDYANPARPVVASRIQDFFGLATTPRLAGGRVPLLLHLLAPNGRPQQVTDDLASFWRSTYPIVRKELAGRYPKHRWPIDPTPPG